MSNVTENILENRMPPFAQIPLALICDTRLSAGAVRIMCYLFSRPPGWIINNFDIMNKLAIKRRETIAGYWRELIDIGWIFRETRKCNKGKFLGYKYILHYDLKIPDPSSEPCTENPDTIPCTENQYSGKSVLPENSTHNNIDINYIDPTNIDIPLISPPKGEGEREKVVKKQPEQEHKILDIREVSEDEKKLAVESAFATWQQIAKDSNVDFTESEWDCIYGYVIAKPKLQPHQIQSRIYQLNKFANEGLDIENCLLSSQDTRVLIQPKMRIMTDDRGNRIYGQQIVEKRNRIIQQEKETK